MKKFDKKLSKKFIKEIKKIENIKNKNDLLQKIIGISLTFDIPVNVFEEDGKLVAKFYFDGAYVYYFRQKG